MDTPQTNLRMSLMGKFRSLQNQYRSVTSGRATADDLRRRCSHRSNLLRHLLRHLLRLHRASLHPRRLHLPNHATVTRRPSARPAPRSAISTGSPRSAPIPRARKASTRAQAAYHHWLCGVTSELHARAHKSSFAVVIADPGFFPLGLVEFAVPRFVIAQFGARRRVG